MTSLERFLGGALVAVYGVDVVLHNSPSGWLLVSGGILLALSVARPTNA